MNESTVLLALLRKIPGYQDSGEDELYITLLQEEFPDCNLEDELRKFLIWMIDRKADPKTRQTSSTNLRLRFRSWVVRSMKGGAN